MKLLICIVNYKSDDLLVRFLSSIRYASHSGVSRATPTVLVIDNSLRGDDEKGPFLARVRSELPECEVIFPQNNLGYFGALPLAQARQASLAASVVIFCNADIVLADDFFDQLDTLSATPAAVVAPAIISDLGDGVDQNPQRTHRISTEKLRTLQLLYSLGVTFFIHQFLGNLKVAARKYLYRHSLQSVPASPATIYAPHGALFIFTDAEFFMHLPRYEPFLFGEELFIAEEALLSKKTIIYCPQLRVLDSCHASTGLLSISRRRAMMKESIDFILRKYHKPQPS